MEHGGNKGTSHVPRFVQTTSRTYRSYLQYGEGVKLVSRTRMSTWKTFVGNNIGR
ncbi:hypothetical protein AMTR_s00155p00094350, partial [Amborella trichopoda]